jgi:hypothetical protein
MSTDRPQPLADYLRELEKATAAAAEHERLDHRRRLHLRVWEWASRLDRKKGRRQRAIDGTVPSAETDRLVREEFARRVAALGRLLAATTGGKEALTWWQGMAENPIQEGLVVFALAGRPDLVTELLDAARPGCPTVLGDLLNWMRRCEGAILTHWWPVVAESEPAAEPAPPVAMAGGAKKAKGKDVNGRLTKLCTTHPQCIDWSAEKLAGELTCSKSCVIAAKYWQTILVTRAQRKAETLQRRKDLEGVRDDGRRRPRKMPTDRAEDYDR